MPPTTQIILFIWAQIQCLCKQQSLTISTASLVLVSNLLVSELLMPYSDHGPSPEETDSDSPVSDADSSTPRLLANKCPSLSVRKLPRGHRR